MSRSGSAWQNRDSAETKPKYGADSSPSPGESEPDHPSRLRKASAQFARFAAVSRGFRTRGGSGATGWPFRRNGATVPARRGDRCAGTSPLGTCRPARQPDPSAPKDAVLAGTGRGLGRLRFSPVWRVHVRFPCRKSPQPQSAIWPRFLRFRLRGISACMKTPDLLYC